MPTIVNIAVIGAGTMAQAVHMPVLRKRWDRFAVTAVVDHSERRRREACEVWGIDSSRRHETVADLISAIRAKKVTVDAAVLATDGLHVDDVLALIRRGIPVLVEPPLGYSAPEIAKVADLERTLGRRFVMMAYPQLHDDVVTSLTDRVGVRDLRMIDYEVIMPAAQPLFGHAKVTSSAFDLPRELRTLRRDALQAAVEAGSGDGATQRDRDLFVKGMLTGLAHQLAVLESTYGPITTVVAARQWPETVIPGSIEVLGELKSGAAVRVLWQYLPFSPVYGETLTVTSARRRMVATVAAPSHADDRSSVWLREKSSGRVVTEEVRATQGSAESMWEAFHSFVVKGGEPVNGARAEQERTVFLRSILARIVEDRGRSLDAPANAEGSAVGVEAPVEVEDSVADADSTPVVELDSPTAGADSGISTVDEPAAAPAAPVDEPSAIGRITVDSTAAPGANAVDDPATQEDLDAPDPSAPADPESDTPTSSR